MSPEERAALAAAVEPRKQEAGWRLADDPVTGARVGLPGQLATKATAVPNGTRWTSAQGQLQIETFRIDTGATLDAVFEQQKKMPRRRVEHNALQSDSFVISGMQGLKKIVVRGYAENGEVRGITILYDQAMEAPMDPLVAPMSSAFVPFAAGFAVAGAADAPRRKVEYGTGVFVSAVRPSRHRPRAGRRLQCHRAAGARQRRARRRPTQAASSRCCALYGARNLTPVGMLGGARRAAPTSRWSASPIRRRRAAARAISAVTPSLAPRPTRPLETAPAPGFAGAAALDAQGRFAGMVVLKVAGGGGPGGAPQAARGAGRAHPQFPRGQLRRAGLRQARRRGGQGVGDARDLREEITAAVTCS